MNSSITLGACSAVFSVIDVHGRRYAVVVDEIIVIAGALGHLIGNIALILLFGSFWASAGICSLMKPMYIAELQ